MGRYIIATAACATSTQPATIIITSSPVSTHIDANSYAFSSTPFPSDSIFWRLQHCRLQWLHFLFRCADMRQHVLLLQQPVRHQLPVLHLQWRRLLDRRMHDIHAHPIAFPRNPHQSRCRSRRHSHRRHVHVNPTGEPRKPVHCARSRRTLCNALHFVSMSFKKLDLSHSRAAAPHTCLPRELPLARGTVSPFPIVSKTRQLSSPVTKTVHGLK